MLKVANLFAVNALAVMTCVFIVVSLSVASADEGPKCRYRDPMTGECVLAPDPVPRVPVPGPSGPGDDGGGERRCVDRRGHQVACHSAVYGWWSQVWRCYFKPTTPTPGPSDWRWQGHFPDGAVYTVFCPYNEVPRSCTRDPFSGGGVCFAWFDEPPYVTVSPEELVQRAIRSMRLRGPDIGIVPEPGAGRVGLVGMPVWMWTTATPQTWGPNSATAAATGIRVWATAKAAYIDWSMGDGRTRRCTSPGTAYRDASEFRDSPDCGHRYQSTSQRMAGGRFTVTGSTHWSVDWRASTGERGSISMDLRASVRIRISEMQVLIS